MSLGSSSLGSNSTGSSGNARIAAVIVTVLSSTTSENVEPITVQQNSTLTAVDSSSTETITSTVITSQYVLEVHSSTQADGSSSIQVTQAQIVVVEDGTETDTATLLDVIPVTNFTLSAQDIENIASAVWSHISREVTKSALTEEDKNDIAEKTKIAILSTETFP